MLCKANTKETVFKSCKEKQLCGEGPAHVDPEALRKGHGSLTPSCPIPPESLVAEAAGRLPLCRIPLSFSRGHRLSVTWPRFRAAWAYLPFPGGGSCFPKATLRGRVLSLDLSAGKVPPQPTRDVQEQTCWVFGNHWFAFRKPFKEVEDNHCPAAMLGLVTAPCNHGHFRTRSKIKDGKSPRRCKNRENNCVLLTLKSLQDC